MRFLISLVLFSLSAHAYGGPVTNISVLSDGVVQIDNGSLLTFQPNDPRLATCLKLAMFSMGSQADFRVGEFQNPRSSDPDSFRNPDGSLDRAATTACEISAVLFSRP